VLERTFDILFVEGEFFERGAGTPLERPLILSISLLKREIERDLKSPLVPLYQRGNWVGQILPQGRQVGIDS
jgi:hypothetical protein